MADQIVITEKSSQAKDVRAAVDMNVVMSSAGGFVDASMAIAAALMQHRGRVIAIVDKDANLTINRDDEIVAATLLCSGGEVLRK